MDRLKKIQSKLFVIQVNQEMLALMRCKFFLRRKHKQQRTNQKTVHTIDGFVQLKDICILHL